MKIIAGIVLAISLAACSGGGVVTPPTPAPTPCVQGNNPGGCPSPCPPNTVGGCLEPGATIKQ